MGGEGYGDGVHETWVGEFHAVSNKVLQGGSIALPHRVFKWLKITSCSGYLIDIK
jgi:hypothetical protein